MTFFLWWLILGELFVAYIATLTREYHNNYRFICTHIGRHSRRSALIGLSLTCAIQCIFWPLFLALYLKREKPK